MCTRMTMKTSGDELARLFGVEQPIEVPARFNLAPTDPVPVVRLQGESADDVADEPIVRTLSLVRWGLIPSWAKDPRLGVRMVNARMETVAEKPAFRSAFTSRRCLVLADGFYEWKKVSDSPRKQPFHIRRVDGLPFALAGLWERWWGPDHTVIDSCAVITRPSLGAVAELHDRMPSALDPGDVGLWLDHAMPEAEVIAALERADMVGTALFEQYPVDRYVSSVGNEGPRCVRRLEEVKSGPKQGALF